ncbi:MAG: hypothetical protein U9R25_11450 [Chloroflexota bacterium]|nr:hypothetical protein [Chloroflexota bacterium]
MKWVIGLFPDRASAENGIVRLRATGLPEEDFSLQDRTTPREDLVECTPRDKTRSTMVSFTMLSTFVFGVFGLMAGLGTMAATDASPAFAMGTLLVFLLIGGGNGLFMGAVKGRSDAEEDIQNLREGIVAGNPELIVTTDKPEKVEGIMKSENATQVNVCSEIRPMELLPGVEQLSAGSPAATH